MVVDAASHSIIDPGSKADIRPTYQPLLPSPRRSLFTLPRVVPWSLPLEDYGVGTSLSSPRVLSSSTRSHAETSAALSSAFSSLVSLATVTSCTPRSTPRWCCLLAHPRQETFAVLIPRFLGQTQTCVKPTAFSTCPRLLILCDLFLSSSFWVFLFF